MFGWRLDLWSLMFGNYSLHEETTMPKIAPTPEVKLTDDEQEHLFALIHKGQHSARVITRARILSKLDRGHSHQEICSALEVSLPTVLKIRKRLAEGGLEAALSELPRPGAKPKLDAKQAAMITAIACSKAPDGHDHWTLRMLGSKIVELGFASSYSHEGVRKFLKKMNSNPGKSSSGASPKLMKSSLPAWRM
jgi:transposase